jgi:PAS domain-containing protein
MQLKSKKVFQDQSAFKLFLFLVIIIAYYTSICLAEFQVQADISGAGKVITFSKILLVILFISLLIFTYKYLRLKRSEYNEILNALVKVNLEYRIDSKDIRHYNSLKPVIVDLHNNVKRAINFVGLISQGNYNIGWHDLNEVAPEESHKNLATALFFMKEQLQRIRLEEEQSLRNSEGLRKLTEITHKFASIEEFGDLIISFLVKYIDSKIGSVFITMEDDKGKYLQQMSCYAFERKKYLEKRVEFDQGLIGSAFQSGDIIHVTQIPKNYLSITSGLGDATPASLIIVPLKNPNGIVEGIVELASFKKYSATDISFLEKAAAIIGASIYATKTNKRTQELLDKSVFQADELQRGKVEMAQTIEELQAMQEEIIRIKKEEKKSFEASMQKLDDMRTMMRDLLNCIPQKIYVKDNVGRIVLVNDEVAKHYPGKKAADLIGTTDEDHFGDQAKGWWTQELSIINSGNAFVIDEDEVLAKDGSKQIFKSIKMPFYIAPLKATGILGIQTDITEMVLLKRDRNTFA